MCMSRESVWTLKNSPAMLKPPNVPSTSIVVAPFDTNTRTEPNVSKRRSSPSKWAISSSMTRSAGNGLKTPKQPLQMGNIEFHDPIRWKCSDDLDLRHAEVTGQLQSHLLRVLLNGGSDAIFHFIRLHTRLPCATRCR